MVLDQVNEVCLQFKDWEVRGLDRDERDVCERSVCQLKPDKIHEEMLYFMKIPRDINRYHEIMKMILRYATRISTNQYESLW